MYLIVNGISTIIRPYGPTLFISLWGQGRMKVSKEDNVKVSSFQAITGSTVTLNFLIFDRLIETILAEKITEGLKLNQN